MTRWILTVALLLALPSSVGAACGGSSPTWTAVDASYAEVADCVSKASSGDTINVPAGTETWDAPLTITKRIWLIGAGIGQTVITSNAGTPTGDGTSTALIRYVPSDTTSTDYFRLSGFTLNANNLGMLLYVSRTGLTPTYVRIDYNRFIARTTSATPAMANFYGLIYGVVDHNTLNNCVHWDIYGLNTTSWANLTFTPGSASSLFFEDNTYNDPTGTIETIGQGANAVYRYNTFNLRDINYSPLSDVHGNNEAGSSFGAFGSEWYGNYYSQPYPTARGLNMVDLRGGKNIYFFNWKTSLGNDYVRIVEEYIDSVCAPYDYALDGTPQRINNTYLWNNRRKAAGTEAIQYSHTVDVDNSVNENEHYFLQSASFDGTAGIGCGTLAERNAITPTTVGVGFWVTDQSCSAVTTAISGSDTTRTQNISGTLYKWNGSTWDGTGLYASYTPYTYPHPFVSAVVVSPTAPLNVRIR